MEFNETGIYHFKHSKNQVEHLVEYRYTKDTLNYFYLYASTIDYVYDADKKYHIRDEHIPGYDIHLVEPTNLPLFMYIEYKYPPFKERLARGV